MVPQMGRTASHTADGASGRQREWTSDQQAITSLVGAARKCHPSCQEKIVVPPTSIGSCISKVATVAICHGLQGKNLGTQDSFP